MICDKCGKSNIMGLAECSYCGADMPPATCCSGFADILSFGVFGENTPPNSSGYINKENFELKGMRDSDMQKLLKKSDNIMKTTQKNSLFGLIAIGLSFLILISSIVFGIRTVNTVNSYKEETIGQIDETKKELNEYKALLDSILAEIEKDNKEDEKADNKGGKNTKNTTDEDKEKTTNETSESNEKKITSETESNAEENILNKKESGGVTNGK